MATIRPYDPADLGRALALWDGQVDVDGALGGIALGALAGTEGRIVTVTAADADIAELLLDALETALAHHGARTVVGDGELRDLKAAQRAFEREHFGGAGHRARTEDFLACIAETRPSLSEEIVASFDDDVREFARD